MKKIRFGVPEKIVPTNYCKNLKYEETEISYAVENIHFRESERGCILEFPLQEDEQVYGFGLQLKGFNHKGRKLTLRTNSDPVAYTGDSHAPVPFFVTTGCYGMYIDTARYVEVHCGFHKKNKRESFSKHEIKVDIDALYQKEKENEVTVMSIEIPVAKGVDIYIFEGDTINDVVSQYNMLSGGGCTAADWGFETIYRIYAKYNEEQVLDMADYFREKHIPINIIGLEPGWQSCSYSCSLKWDEERFSHHDELIERLKERGYHINLWEHAFINPQSPLYEKLFPYSGDYEVWKGIVPDFGSQEARKIFADYHREQFVQKGIDGFKLDECDSSDYKSCWSFPNCAEFPSGMDGEQYHQMFGMLYMQAIMEALGETTTLSEVRNAGALAASYPFVLYSDLYDHKEFIRGVVNAGFSGLLWTPEVRRASSKKELVRRMQSNVFSCQCIINAWNTEEVPWITFDCEEEAKRLLEVRQQLIPLLQRAFQEYKCTGKPPIRALVADYTGDEETWNIDDEYIFCDSLLVAPIVGEEDTRRVYLPQGRWKDYWTKEEVTCGWLDVTTNEIPVYEKIKEC